MHSYLLHADLRATERAAMAAMVHTASIQHTVCLLREDPRAAKRARLPWCTPFTVSP
jgi:hypothetical protein